MKIAAGYDAVLIEDQRIVGGDEQLCGLVDQVGPTEEGKRQAAAYEAVARRQLDEV